MGHRLRGDDTCAALHEKPHSTAAYTRLRTSVRKYSRCPGPCDMNTANSSSAGSIQKNVPAMPLQKNCPTEPANGAMPSCVRTAKPSPKPWPGDSSVPLIFTPAARWLDAIARSVLRPMMRLPSSVPPPSSIWQNRA